MLYRVKSTIILLVLGLNSGCTAPVQIITTVPELKLILPPAMLPAAIADPAEVVQGFWEAMNARDLDGAMIFIADDVQCRGACYLNGKEAVQRLIQAIFKLVLVVKIEIHDLQIEGDTVTYIVDYYSREDVIKSSTIEVMRVQDGKIIYWEVGGG